MPTAFDPLLQLLQSAVPQPLKLSEDGRVSFRTVDDIVITFEILPPAQDEEAETPAPAEDFYIVSVVAPLPEALQERVDVLTLALAFNRALLVQQFSIALGNPQEGQPEGLLLGYAGTLAGVQETGLAEVISRFSSAAAYLQMELNNLSEE
jgi:hypothetical protein